MLTCFDKKNLSVLAILLLLTCHIIIHLVVKLNYLECELDEEQHKPLKNLKHGTCAFFIFFYQFNAHSIALDSTVML